MTINIVTSILDFLFLSWLFWPIAIMFFLWGAVSVVGVTREDEDTYRIYPLFLLGIAIFAMLYRVPAMRLFNFSDWHNWLNLVGAYVAIGFVVAVIKWALTLHRFRSSNPAQFVFNIRESVRAHPTQDKSFPSVLSRVSGHFNKCVIEVIMDDGSILTPASKEFARYEWRHPDDVQPQIRLYPNWRLYPIGMWWTYWPCYMISVFLEPIHSLLKAIVRSMRHIFNTVARYFSVSA